LIRIASPNHDERRTGIDMLVLHYTGMADGAAALSRLTDPRAKVSSHYLVALNGEVFALVPEKRRAWHAGASSWKGEADLNSHSIGIEIDHPGHEGGNPGYPAAQIAAVIALCGDILSRWPIVPERVLAHSDIAPRRKEDPGENFPWEALGRAGIGHYVAPAPVTPGPAFSVGDDGEGVQELQSLLLGYGYALEASGAYGEQTRSVVTAFQRHFRQSLVDGRADLSTLDTLRRLSAALKPP
jgi:N-acetylmuramoyl-L-alanine amidase